MSWSIQFIGKPENVVKALNEQSVKFNNQSRVEYDSALPHMVALVKENFGPDDIVLKIIASGHGMANAKEQIDRYFTISIERIYGVIV